MEGKQLTENKKNKKVVDKPLKKCYNKYEKIKECARRNNCTATQLVREGIQKVLNP